MANVEDGLTLREIRRQPDSWCEAAALTTAAAPSFQALLSGADHFLFTGCGSSYYLAIAAARVFQETTGRPARAVPASELLLSRETYLAAHTRTALIGFSRSGETTETVTALRLHRASGIGPTMGFTCRAACTMNSVPDLVIPLPAADDHSVVMTSSFTSMLLAAELMAACLAGRADRVEALRALPALLAPQLERQLAFAERVGRDLSFERFIYLGMGPFFGLACEAMLKLKEMTQVPAEAYSPLDFRHGPISMVQPGVLVALLGSDRAERQERDVLRDVRALGGETLLFTGGPDLTQAGLTFEVGEGLDEVVRGLLYMPVVQAIGCYRGLALGRSPESPRHLSHVVVLDEQELR